MSRPAIDFAIYQSQRSASGASRARSVPMVSLRELLETTAPDWQRNVRRLFARMQFVLGDQVKKFEDEFAARMGGKHCVGVGTGTAALQLSLRAAGVTASRQQVITSALTSPFTVHAIRNAGATPVFADVDADRLLIDASDVAQRITSRTAAILPVHLYGQACDLASLRRLASKCSAVIVQDACQAHGATCDGHPLPHFSEFTAYSFYPTKNLGCVGDGGAILTRSARVAAKIRLLRDGGRRGDQISRLPALNSRLDEIQACFLRAFLPKLNEWNARRRQLAGLYDLALSDCPPVRTLSRTAESVNHLYVIRVPQRDRLRAYLAKQGITTAVHYPVPAHLHPAFAEYRIKRGALPRAEQACRQVLSLPLWPHMPESAVLRVAGQVRRFFGAASGE